ISMLLSIPLMAGGRHAGVGRAGDPLMAWAARALSQPLARVMPWLFARSPGLIRWTLLGMTGLVLLWAGRHFFTRAWLAFRHHSADMNTLIALGTGAATIYSLVATLAPGLFTSRGLAPEVYYEAVILIVGLILLGNALEARSKRQTAAALRRLIALQPPVARVIQGDSEVEVPAA